MKKHFCTMILVSLFFAPLFAKADVLNGKTYCRIVIRDGSFGQPKGEGKHCLDFLNGTVEDTANTFFGKGPEFFKYAIRKNIVAAGKNRYVISKDLKHLTTIVGATQTGVVFDLQVSCPRFSSPSPDFCKDGKIVSGGKNSDGCPLPPGCDRSGN